MNLSFLKVPEFTFINVSIESFQAANSFPVPDFMG